MDSESCELLANSFSLACVQDGADLQTERARLVADRARTAERTSGPVEGSHEAIAGGVDLLPLPALELVADGYVMRSEQIAPAPVA